MKKKEITDELRSLDSSLANATENFNYQVTDEYFKELQDQVLVKLDQKDSGLAKKQVRSVFNQKFLMGIAASFMIITAAYFLFKPSIQATDDLQDIDSEKLYDYLTDNLDMIPEEWLYDYMETENISFLDNIKDNDIEIYLEDNIDQYDIEDLERYL